MRPKWIPLLPGALLVFALLLAGCAGSGYYGPTRAQLDAFTFLRDCTAADFKSFISNTPRFRGTL